MTFSTFASMSSLSHASRLICAQLSIEHGLLVGIAFVLMSASISSETLEILAGLVGALVVCVMKKRTSRRGAEKVEPVAAPLRKSRKIAGPKSHLKPPARTPLRKAEPKTSLSFADGMSVDEQVDHLLRDVMPAKEELEICEELAQHLVPPIKKLVPEAKVSIVAHSSIVRIGRTGLRPEVDLIVTVPPDVLARRLLMHMQNNPKDRTVRKFPRIAEADEVTLNKFAIRTVAAQLPFCPLWRTAYRGTEPKVVLLAPSNLGILSEDLHIHVTVNCPNSIRAKEVFDQSDDDIQKLIALVRRWAQDRCIANTAYGHMPLYGWNLFAKYFCQSHSEEYSKKSTMDLFGEFVAFYCNWHDSSNHSKTDACFLIEDPYDAKRNVAESMTMAGVDRFREELDRAKTLVSNGACLDVILEHCHPSPPGKGEIQHSDTIAGFEDRFDDE